MLRRRPQTSSMYIVSINGTDFSFLNEWRFTKFSGIKDDLVMDTYISPFYHRAYQIPTIRRYSPVTLEMPYNSLEHSKIFTIWNRYQNQALTINIEPITGCTVQFEEQSLGYKHVLTGCIWKQCDSVEVTRGENKITELKLEFSITKAEEVEI